MAKDAQHWTRQPPKERNTVQVIDGCTHRTSVVRDNRRVNGPQALTIESKDRVTMTTVLGGGMWVNNWLGSTTGDDGRERYCLRSGPPMMDVCEIKGASHGDDG